tara:strand:+ start:270 stop:950 length:681 start_codon:yes stop_codon:yes gene_type:complete
MPLSNWVLLFFLHFALILLLKSDNGKRNQMINSLSRKLAIAYILWILLFVLIDYLDFRFLVKELIKSSGYLIFIIYSSKHLHLLGDIKLKPFNLIITVIASLLFFLLVRELYGSYNSYYNSNFYIISYGQIYAFLLMCILPAVSEEMFFRLVIFDKLKLYYSEINTILISSFFFVLAHFIFNPLISGGYLFLLGITLGIIRIKFKKINYCIIFHMIYNSLAISLFI